MNKRKCIGPCNVPKHQCFDYEEVKPGPIPKNVGWLYTAKTSPKHQLKCGWRPGFIADGVMKKVNKHNCYKPRQISYCTSGSNRCIVVPTLRCDVSFPDSCNLDYKDI
ncbi:hypothetical protein EVAR_46213_1 [Eumeta japonica]|uniref:Uncharacterized protein n=1 Tax=Eumeta variegata TaxID=151549 RepID=A0A4C1WGE3_EUMVA|nr:hypothetical protein EVAR_46213_1 [Eumeta japonica]